MTKDYEQYCPVAAGWERIGERWTLLIVRDLLFGPMRYSDLETRLPGIATNVLASRLKDLQRAGIIDKRELPPPAASTVYQLTDLGHGLLPVLVEVGKWGMHFLPQHAFEGVDLRAVLRSRIPAAIERVPQFQESYEIVVDGQLIGIEAAPGQLEIVGHRPQRPAVRLVVDAAGLAELFMLGKSVAEAETEGILTLEGDVEAAERVIGFFRIPGTEPENVRQSVGRSAP